MGDKDLSEKLFLGLNDVFADVCNAFVFDEPGKIKPEELQPYPTESVVGDASGLRQGFRDVAKVYKQCGVNLLLLGLEDQTAIDYDMAVRVMFADAMHYHNLCADIEKRENMGNDAHSETPERDDAPPKRPKSPKRARFPVITVVLYFGMDRRWTGPRSLHEWLKLPAEFKKLVNDYKITVIEVAYLTPEARQKLVSDFRDLADFMCELKRTGKLPASNRVIDHPQELAAAVKAITGIKIEMNTNERGEITMNNTVREYIEFLKDEGRNEGKAELLTKWLGTDITPDIVADNDAITRLITEHDDALKQEAVQSMELRMAENQQRADAAQQKADAAQQKADAAQQKADAAQQKADAAQQQIATANSKLANLIRNYKGTTEEIAQITQMSVEEIEAIRNSAK